MSRPPGLATPPRIVRSAGLWILLMILAATPKVMAARVLFFSYEAVRAIERGQSAGGVLAYSPRPVASALEIDELFPGVEGVRGQADDASLLPGKPAEGQGTIKGEVYDKQGNGLAGVIIRVTDLNLTGRSDQNGLFTFSNVVSGTHQLTANKLGYFSIDREISVKAEEITAVDLNLEERPVETDDTEYELDEMEIVGEYVEEDNKGFEIDDVASGLKMEASVGRVEFTKKNLSTAADAVAKVAGANIVDGKRPVVRGLADRYITTTFNGGSVASTTPLRKAVELDLFPTNVIENIKVNKIYNASLSGDFGGAAIDIISRSIPEERQFQFKIDTGWNSIDAGDKFYLSQGPELDFWGRPTFPDYRQILRLDDADLQANPARAGERAVLWGNLARTYDFLPKADDQRMDLGFSLLYGDSFKIGQSGRLGVVYSFSHDNEDRAVLNGYVNRGTTGGIYNTDFYDRQVDWSQMLGLTWQINDAHELKATYFKQQIGSNSARHIYNWEDPSGNFEISRQLVTNGPLYQAYGSSISEIIGGDFWSLRQQENSLEIAQLSGRHKLFGDSLESEDRPLLTWALTHTENAITSNTSVTRRIEVDFDSEAVRQLAAGLDISRDEFAMDSQFGTSAQSVARANFLAPRFGTNPDRPLSTATINGIQTWQQLNDLLVNAGVSANAISIYENALQDALTVVTAPRTDYDPERGTQYSIYNGVTPNQLKSFKEYFPQVEKTDNFRADIALPFDLDFGMDSRFTLRVGGNHENRFRSERSLEIEIDNGTYQQGGFDIGADPSKGYAEIFNGVLPPGTPSIPKINVIDTSNVQAARNVDLTQTTSSYYADGEFRSGDFVFRLGTRHEDVKRVFSLIGLGGGESENSADLFGASASYKTWNDFQFIVGMSSTLARPVIKEIVPVVQENREDGSTFRGNFNLLDTAIENLDFTMVFPEFNGISSSVSLFHKRLDDPIVYLDVSGDTFIRNGQTGLIRGVEFETNVDLPGPFTFDANYAYIQGDLDYQGFAVGNLPPDSLTSSFPEQPRQVLNMSLGYESEDWGLNANLAFNYVSEYVVTLPTTAQGAFQVKQPSPKLDFVLTKKLDFDDSIWTLGFSIKNLLGSTDEIWNENYSSGSFQGIRSKYEVGRTYNFWLKGEF